MKSRRLNRIAAWLASFAILLAALAPAVSHAMAAVNGGASWVEVCTATGPALVKVSAKQSPVKDAPTGVSHLEHCPFCGTHAGSAGLIPHAIATLAVESSPALLPELYYRAPRPLFVWAAGQPRAPPAA